MQRYIFLVLQNERFTNPQTLKNNYRYSVDNLMFYRDIIDLSKIYDTEGESPLFEEFLQYILTTPYTNLKSYIQSTQFLETWRRNTIINNIDTYLSQIVYKYDTYIMGRVVYDVLKSIPENIVICVLPDNRIAIGNKDILYIWDPEHLYEKYFRNWTITYIKAISSNILIINSTIYDIKADKQLGLLRSSNYIVSPGGLIAVDTDTEFIIYTFTTTLNEIIRIPNNNVYTNYPMSFIDENTFLFNYGDMWSMLNIDTETITPLSLETPTRRPQRYEVIGDKIIGNSYNYLGVWDIYSNKLIFDEYKMSFQSYILTKDNRIIMSYWGPGFAIYNLRTNKYEYKSENTDEVSAMTLVNKEDVIIVFKNGSMNLFNLNTHTFRHLINTTVINSITNLDNNQFITTSVEGDIKIWK